MSFQQGTLDGRVELRERLGQGGMGEVHAAWDRSLQRAVAVKFVHGTDPKDGERLLLEARLQARVDHPHVVRVFEVGVLGGRPCILMQLIRGQGLDDLAASLPIADRVELVRQAATGLHAAHLQGLVHRDVKPGNVLVEASEDGSRTACVSDFGVAHTEEGGLTRSGLLQGTLDYMAPEQLAGAGPVDFRCDVYSLGATLYAVLAGRPPFRPSVAGPDQSGEAQVRLMRRILDEEPPDLATIAPDVPRELRLIAARAMEKEPADRYASAAVFAEDLARFQRGEPIQARAPTVVERAVKWSRRNRAASRAIAAALATLLAGGGFALWQARRAGLEALEAARLGAEAAELQELMRVEMLLPAHDLSPAYQRIRQAMAALSARPPVVAAGAAAFTLGRGHQLLGDDREAHGELTRAWELGFRRPEAARALAETEGRLYARELAMLGRIDDPALRQARLDELARRYREPALARLRGLPAATEGDRLLISARIALVERRFEEAAGLAGQSFAAGGDPLEAPALEGEARVLGAFDRLERGELPAARSLLASAAESLERAIAIARSAPGPRLLLARVHVIQYDIGSGTLGFRLPPLDAIVEQLREAERLDPAGVEVRNVWSGVEKRRGDAIAAAGGDFLPAYRGAVEQAERGVAAASSDPRQPLLQLANTSYALAEAQASLGIDPLPAVDRCIAAASRARDLSPAAGGPVFNLAQARSFRALWVARHGGDARAGAAEAVADARGFLALGERPVTARIILAKALQADADARWRFGEEAEAPFVEGAQVLQEAAKLAPTNSGVLAAGLLLAVGWAEQALAEGRSPAAALAAGQPWATAMLPLAKGNVYYAAMVGSFYVVQARAELAARRDPAPWLERAAPLLSPTAGEEDSRVTLGEAELVRARWAREQGRDPAPAVRRAAAHAVAARALDATAAGAPLLEAEALLDLPHPARADLERARAALDRAVALDPRLGQAWLADARARAALGDRTGALTSLQRAAAVQPRLEGLAGLRAALEKP